MWLSDNWADYQLLDCSDGERLERWGSYTLVRPDPQVVWHTPRRHAGWTSHDARYLRADTGGGHWTEHQLPPQWDIRYKDYTFRVKPMNFKHTGLFPEQATNWDFLRDQIRAAHHQVQALNLFAYTGGATIAAAEAGADVCHVDAARGMVAWARENAEASGLTDRPIRWIVDDCRAFVAREIKRGRRYDVLIMDPPSYGRGPTGEVWKLEDNLYDFISLCAGVLSDNPLCVVLSSYTTGLAPGVLSYLLQSILSPRFGGRAESEELGLRVAQNGLILPCGATGRWIA